MSNKEDKNNSFSEVFNPLSQEEKTTNVTTNSTVINRANSQLRNRFTDEEIGGIKMLDSRPVVKFKFNIKAFAFILISIVAYYFIVTRFLGNLYDKYIADFFLETLSKAIKDGTPDTIISLFGLFVPILTILFVFISVIGFFIYNFIFNGDKMELFKGFLGKSILYSAVLAIALVTLYRYANIDLLTPILKVLTINSYIIPGFKGI